MNQNRLFLLDAYALIFRSYYAFIKNPRINSKNLNTSAIFGFINSLLELIKKENPTHLGVCFDVEGKTFRHEEFPEYKANRNKTPETIHLSLPHIYNLLRAMHVPILGIQGYEADDLIGTLAKIAENNNFQVFIVTLDKDFAQLVSKNIFIYKLSSHGNDIEILGVEEVKTKFEVQHPLQVIDLLGMMGDSSDNIPGLPGIGEKTAKKLLKQFDSLENLLENIDQLNGEVRRNVENNKSIGLISKRLATINIHVPIEFQPKKFILKRPSDWNWKKIQLLFEELEFKYLYKIICSIYSNTNNVENFSFKKTSSDSDSIQSSLFKKENTYEFPIENSRQNINNTLHVYHLINDDYSLDLMIKILHDQDEFSFDVKTTTEGLDKIFIPPLLGIAFSYQKNKGYYVKFPTSLYEQKKIIEKMRPIFEDISKSIIGYDLKFNLKVLKKYGLEPKGTLFDILLAHYLLQPDSNHKLESLSENYLNYSTIKYENLIPGKNKKNIQFENVSLELQKEYTAENADIALQLKKLFEQKLIETKTLNLFQSIEIPLISVLAHMEYKGVKIDEFSLKEMSNVFQNDLLEIASKVYKNAGYNFNLNSYKQLGEYLFEHLQNDTKVKKTKTGKYKTSEDILHKMSERHPIINEVLKYRQIQKLKSTYVDGLLKKIHLQSNRIHTTFIQSTAITGRLVCKNPNLQNIPIRSDRGRLIRKSFIAEENHVILAADYSQIELRLITEMSGEITLKKDFIQGLDIHTSTASKLFSIPISEITRKQRNQAKIVNFGIIYGVSAFGLAEYINISRSEAQNLIDKYFQTYPNLKLFINDQIMFARKNGFVETLLGRRRYLTDINSINSIVRSHAERNAINSPVQGTAADIIKLAMINLHSEFKSKKLKSKILLQVHDELVFEVPLNEIAFVKSIIKHEMENAFICEVPLVVEIGMGNNWMEAH